MICRMSTATGTRQRSAELAGQVATRAISVVLAAIGLATLAESLRFQYVSADTVVVLETVERALVHIRNGQFHDWGGAYPLLQAIPAFLLRATGLSRSTVITDLVLLNVAAFAAMIWFAWWDLRRRSRASGPSPGRRSTPAGRLRAGSAWRPR